MTALAGVDGCKAGWIAAFQVGGNEARAEVFGSFEELIDALPQDAIVAVDMPIGLPERSSRGGRGPEMLVRPLLGARQSSVFSIPPRLAVEAGRQPFSTLERFYEDHRRASMIARGLTDPPRGVSIQAFGIFPKICELDALLAARPGLSARVFESHPELAFWRLNGGRAMGLPKKVKGQVHEPGMNERRRLLSACGIAPELLDTVPRGAGADDLLDACAMLCIAGRVAAGQATPFPDPPGRDARGVPVAIWA